MILLFALLFALACGGPPSSGGSTGYSSSGGSEEIPELSDDVIFNRINGTRVREVLPESGTGEPISWGFDEEEPKEIKIVDKQINGTKATIVLDIKTQSSPRAKNLRYVFGQMRTEWEIETGWVLRRWSIVDTESISMKYRDAPKPTPTEELKSNSNSR